MKLLLATLALVALAVPAQALVLDSGDGQGNTTPPADDPGYTHVGRFGTLSVIYVGYGWVLSASHVSMGDVEIDGVVYPAVPGSRVVFDHDPTHKADIEAFQIDPAPEHLSVLPIRSSEAPLGTPAIVIARGFDRGAPITWRGIDGYEWAVTTGKRWGTNLIGGVIQSGNPPTNRANVSIGSQITTALVTDFTKNAVGSDHEVQAAIGDSGGALFIKEGGIWELAGILFAIDIFPGQPSSTALYGNPSYYADLDTYVAQILDVIRPCDDGADNDLDTATDYPDDPGCNWVGDVSEEFDCSDGLDNDWDGLFDYPNDPECASPTDPLEELDQDGDLVIDGEDNCVAVANADQRDTNQDGYGNSCDTDYNNDGVVGGPDFQQLISAFGSSTGDPAYDPDLDSNGDGVIGGTEYILLLTNYGGVPGPSGLACAGTIPCP
jgi:hypothetical protein